MNIKNIKFIFAIILSLILNGHYLKADTIDNQFQNIDTLITSIDSIEFVTDSSTNGDFILKTIILDKNSDKSDLKAILLSIFYIILGIVLTKFLDYLNDRKKISQIGNRWIAETRGLDQPIRNQIIQLETFAKEIEKETIECPDLQLISVLDCENFKMLDRGELFKYLRRKHHNYADAVNASNSIQGFITILFHIYSVTEKRYNNYQSEVQKHLAAFNRSIENLMQSFADYGVSLEKELEGDPIKDERYAPIATLIFNHISANQKDIFVIEKQFLEPLLFQLSHLRHIDEALRMTSSVSNAFHDINRIRIERRQLLQSINDMIKQYQTQLKDMDRIVKLLDFK